MRAATTSFGSSLRLRTLTVTLAGVLALAACGSSSSKSGSGSGGPEISQQGSGSKTTALCKRFSADDAAELFGETAVVKPETIMAMAKEQCIYINKNRALDHPYWLLQVRHYTQPAVFDAHHIAYKTYTNISGVGDAAFVAPEPLGTGWTAQVKKGNDVYTVSVSVASGRTKRPDVSKDAFLALIRSKLG